MYTEGQNVATGVTIMAPSRRLPEKDHEGDEKDEEVDRIGELRDALAIHLSLVFDYMGGNVSLSRHHNGWLCPKSLNSPAVLVL